MMGGVKLGKKKRLVIMFTMTFSFMLTELVVGYCGNSMALVADSFHMLSDVVALLIAFVSILISPRKWKNNTYGWARAEVLGALINSVFLIALCFSIFIEAIKRFFHPEPITEPKWIFTVGAFGLGINLIGLLLFRGHAHTHGHSHDGSISHSHSHKKSQKSSHSHSHTEKLKTDENSLDMAKNEALNLSKEIEAQKVGEAHIHIETDLGNQKQRNSSQMNMRGVFLHVLADALGSVAVLISSGVVWALENKRNSDSPCWKLIDYIDPTLSLLIVSLILSSTWPLLRQACLIMLQAVPRHLDVQILKGKLEGISGVTNAHELHIWELGSGTLIASAHLLCEDLTDYSRISKEATDIFNFHGIDSTTVQAEFLDISHGSSEDSQLRNRKCLLKKLKEETHCCDEDIDEINSNCHKNTTDSLTNIPRTENNYG